MTRTTTQLIRPSAVLLDHGGVIVESVKEPGRLRGVAQEVHRFLAAVGSDVVSIDEIAQDLQAAQQMYSAWKEGNVRRPAPREITHREYWEEFVAPDWPASARTAVSAHATPLCRLLVKHGVSKSVRDGMCEFLEDCASTGIRCGIVSNTLVGDVNRDIAVRLGTAKHFAVQVYSDEVGMRKPNPEIIRMATRALGVEAADTWFVGDQMNRDVLGARRAGVGGVVLMKPPTVRDKPNRVAARVTADVQVENPEALRDLLRATLDAGDGGDCDNHVGGRR